MAEVELQQVGTYTITGLLRTSSTSTFYTGKQGRKARLIQYFHTPLTTTEAQEAFLVRATKLKKLKNRDIVNVLDADLAGEHAYLVLEDMPGETLRQRTPSGACLPVDQVRLILSNVAAALQYAHVNNVVHGNLHPEILLYGRATYQLSEFALFLPELDDALPATPYMAPEQLQGQPELASDQYALGVMVYEWLCGQRPYAETERTALLQRQLDTPVLPLREVKPDLSPALERVVMQALARHPEDRYSHIQDFSDQYLSALMGFQIKATTLPAARPLTIPSTPAAVAPSRPQEQTIPLPVTPIPVEATSSPTQVDAEKHNGEIQVTRRLIYSDTDPEQIQATPQEQASEAAHQQATQERRATVLRMFDAEEATKSADEQANDDKATTRREPRVSPSPDPGWLRSIITDDLCQGGVLSQSLPGYEERPAQVEMSTIVARALSEYRPAIIEAGTGTGKSLAYLVPVVRSGKVAIVSTANKALQEQLFYKDIPFIQKHIKHFEAALVKGVNNYVCRDRVESERIGMQYLTKNREFQRLLDIVNDPDSSFMGDFETLGFQLPADVRGRVATDSDQCAWNKCSFFDECYVRQMRERAEMAQVIVVNHTLLLLDAAMGGYLLPERDVIILDEAHHLEEEATRAFTEAITPVQVQTLLAQRMLRDHSSLKLQDEATQVAQQLWAYLEMNADFGNKGRMNLEQPVETGLRLANLISDLTDSMRRGRPIDLPDKEGQLYDKLLKRGQNLADSMKLVFSVAQPDKYVYYLERVEGGSSRSNTQIMASAAPLDVTSWLKQKLFDKCNVICTSATLATVGPNPTNPAEKGPNFAYFRRRIGLDAEERPEVLERVLPLTFDYESNALLYVPRHLPQPTFGSGSDEYMKSIAREMYRLVKLSRGRAFLLFSSRRMLDRAYELMSPHLDYPLLKQGDMTRLELTKRFRKEEGAVLFGLKSFWEGVDIAGDALSLVVIDKLPFDPPDDPVHEARVAMMKAAGENWFGTYVLPQAVLRLKQGIGRLLRTREDRGVMAILDTRLYSKGYGKMVLSAMPPARQTANVRDVERFFAPPS